MSARDNDFRIASFALAVSQGADAVRRVGLDKDTLTSGSELAHEIYRAIAVRGATVTEIVKALRSVRPNGSILKDLKKRGEP